VKRDVGISDTQQEPTESVKSISEERLRQRSKVNKNRNGKARVFTLAKEGGRKMFPRRRESNGTW
jgi:hypothetical protein